MRMSVDLPAVTELLKLLRKGICSNFAGPGGPARQMPAQARADLWVRCAVVAVTSRCESRMRDRATAASHGLAAFSFFPFTFLLRRKGAHVRGAPIVSIGARCSTVSALLSDLIRFC